MSTAKTKRDGADLWSAIKEAEFEDDYEEIAAMSPAEVDAYIRENGGDPEGIRARGAAFTEKLLAKLDRNDWHDDAKAKMASGRKTAASFQTKTKLPRKELIERVTAFRNDPRFAAPVTALFRDKTLEASTDEELRALLDQIALLSKLEEK